MLKVKSQSPKNLEPFRQVIAITQPDLDPSEFTCRYSAHDFEPVSASQVMFTEKSQGVYNESVILPLQSQIQVLDCSGAEITPITKKS